MRRFGWTPAFASALLHAALLGVVLLLGRGSLRPDDITRPIEIEISRAPDAEGALPERRVNDREPRRPDVRSRSAGGGRGIAAPSSEPVAGPATGAVAADSEPERRPIDLSLSAVPAEKRAEIAGPPPAGAIRARPRSLSVDELRAELERTEDAVANVVAGRVDPLLYDYLRGARTRFDADARRLADALEVGADAAVTGWARGYLKRVQDIQRGADGTPGSRDAADDARRRRPDLSAAYGEAGRQAEDGAERRQVEICLDVAAGQPTSTTVRRSSGNIALDAVALDAFEKSVAARPVPPDARGGRACYEVTIAAHRAPPLPFLSCGFGSTGLTCVWPFKKVTSVSGRLVGVEYPGEDRSASGGSLLRQRQ